MQCNEGIRRTFEARLPIIIYTVDSVLSPAKFERCVLSDMKIARGSPLLEVLLLVYISKMYFSHWKTPGVSERMRSVNLDASI